MIKRLTLEKSALQYMKEQTVSFEEMMLALSGQFKQLFICAPEKYFGAFNVEDT